MDVDIEEPDWQILAGMGSGAEKGLEAAGIDDFDGAVEVCAELQAASGAEYKPDDLICFLCLSQHKEAVRDPGMPAPARPVSIEEDLGLDPLPTPEECAVQPLKARRWRAGILLQQPLAQPKSRLWRARTLLQPLAQPTSQPLVSIALPVVSVQGSMLPLLPIVSAISLVQCCRSLHGGGLCFTDRLADGCRRVADSVAAIPARLLHPGQVPVLVEAGVTRSTILRTVACAWDWLEKCPPVLFDESLLPLALLRLAIRFEGAKDHEEAALKLFEPLDEKPALLSLERRLVEALWSAQGLSDGVECPSQPMAR